jgi:light-regulated signal transduction histidine kinase (bacteriophytochrome)
MSASSHSFPTRPQAPDVLGELLHSLSQPLTSLRCSLELSLEVSPEQVAERQQESVAIALQQTEKVIGMIQLMREYLDAEQPGPEASSTALAPSLRSVIEDLSSIAAVRGIQLRLVGTCLATVPVPEPRLRLALQYLIATMVEVQPSDRKITLLLGQGPAGTVLRVEGERGSHEPNVREPNFHDLNFHDLEQNATSHSAKLAPVRASSASLSTLRRVRLAIARRVLETAGASLVLAGGGADPTGFVLRVPLRVGAPAQ